MENTTVNEEREFGKINISDEVVSIVASLAANSVKGVAGMVSSISGGFAELLGKKNLSKGVKVSVTDKNVSLDLSIIVEYGSKIPDVAWEIQEKVKSEVEAMTGLNVTAVNVSVEGVNVPKAEPVKPAETAKPDKNEADKSADTNAEADAAEQNEDGADETETAAAAETEEASAEETATSGAAEDGGEDRA